MLLEWKHYERAQNAERDALLDALIEKRRRPERTVAGAGFEAARGTGT
jgi:hypothetical protein